MSLKFKINMFAIIMYLSLICVGFASWTLSVKNIELSTDTNVVSSENIINTSEEITINKVSSFKYFNNGFISNDNTLTHTANVIVELTINRDICKEVTVDFKINDLITNLVFDSISCEIEGTTDETVYSSFVTIDTTKLAKDEVKLIFTLKANKDTFVDKVYNPLINNTDKNIFYLELNVTKEINKE